MTTKINHLSKAMDKKKLESFKKRLEERQQVLRKAVSRTEEDGRIADQDTAQDIADRAASSYTKEFLFSQSNNDCQQLAIVVALRKQELFGVRAGSTVGNVLRCVLIGNASVLFSAAHHFAQCQLPLFESFFKAFQLLFVHVSR